MKLAQLFTLGLALSLLASCENKTPAPPGPAAPPAVEDPEAARKALADKVAERARLVLSFGTNPSKEDKTKLELLTDEIRKRTVELEPGSDEKQQALVDGLMEKYHAELWKQVKEERLKALGTAAKAQLKGLQVKQVEFCEMDRDEDGRRAYWVADLSGLARMRKTAGGEPLRFVSDSVARADARPCVPLGLEGIFGGRKLAPVGEAAALKGYWFVALRRFEAGGKEEPYDAGEGSNPQHFGYCAYPAEYGKTGKFTYLTSEAGVIWSKDTAGAPVEVMPADPAKSGWSQP